MVVVLQTYRYVLAASVTAILFSVEFTLELFLYRVAGASLLTELLEQIVVVAVRYVEFPGKVVKLIVGVPLLTKANLLTNGVAV